MNHRYCAPTAGGQKLEERLWEPLNFILTEEVNGMSTCI